MSYLKCEIQKNVFKSDIEYFEVLSIEESKTYIIPKSQLERNNLEIGEIHYFEKKQNLKSRRYFLEYVHSENNKLTTNHHYYTHNNIYEFEIINFESELNKKNEIVPIAIVKDVDGNLIKVSCLKWQNKTVWTYKTLFCLINYFSKNGIPQLIIKDFRHPIYKINQIYEFKVVKEKSKVTATGIYNVFELLGEDNCIHEVNMFPLQKIANLEAEYIKCKVSNITTNLRLLQNTNKRDQFYTSFDNIIDDKKIKNKYFKLYFDNQNLSNKDEIQLVYQYNSFSAFWVFTYANKILPKLFRESIDKLDYKTAKEINKLIISFEEWILNKGIITSFPDEEKREFTTLKAKSQLESSKKIDFTLTILIKNQYYYLSEDECFTDTKNSFSILYYLIVFSKIEIIDTKLLIDRLQNLLSGFNINSKSDLFYLNGLLNYISKNKKVFISEKENENFSLSSSKISNSNFTTDENNYIVWSYAELIISNSLSKKEHSNILVGQLLKLFTKSTTEIHKKEILLYNSYKYFENYQVYGFEPPFNYNSHISIDYNLLISKGIEDEDDWDELENSFVNNNSFKVLLTKKSKTGYEVKYNNLKGFLPYHHIKDRLLKSYPFEDSNFSINAKCISISKQFNFFIIEQIKLPDLLDEFKANKEIVIGQVYDAIIKGVESYGLFLITSSGEGLLYKKEIFDFKWVMSNINNYFKVGQKIKVQLVNVTEDNKLEFNFFTIKKLFPLYYDDYVERIFSYNTEELFETNKEIEEDTYFEIALNEKAYCIEQYAVLQSDLNEKLKNLQIAKQFYTNAKNARSFLINIYTSYFEILTKIKLTLQNGSLEDINNIKQNANDIKNKINIKTIETFPDSDKLIFFLDIISKFNEKSDLVLNLLFEYIKKYSIESSNNELKTIAKITLANNLLLSESKTDIDFSLKNLRLIYDYISNGILSLEETIEDKYAREVKEELLIWGEKIKEDESETLEFKSTLFTPIPDESRLKRIEALSKLESLTEANKNEISKINGDLAKKSVIHSALKTLSAFSNHKGGTLLLGVNDEKRILGLEQEYKNFSKKDQNRDGFGKYFDGLVRNYIGDSFSSLMERKFLKFPEGDILIVTIAPSQQEVFLLKNEEGKDAEQLYIRNLSSSKELVGSELVKFIKNRQ